MQKGRPSVVEAELHEFADGQTPRERESAVLAYLAENPAEAARVQAWRRQNDLIRASFERVARETVPISLSLGPAAPGRYAASPVAVKDETAEAEGGLRAIDPPEPQPLPRPGPRKAHAAEIGLASFVLGVSVAFGLVGLLILASGARDPPSLGAPFSGAESRGLAQRAAEAYRAFAGDGGESAANGPGLAKWLRQRTGMALTPPDLAHEGLSLARARVIPDEAGPSALLIYDGPEAERLVLQVARPLGGAEGAAQGPRLLESAGSNIVTFATAKWRYALTGPGAAERLLKIARGLAAAEPVRK